MRKRVTWDQAKANRRDSESRRRGYHDAQESLALGIRVRTERERRGITQSELAGRMGTTQPAVARLEAGGVTPSLGTLRRVADALGLELVIDFREH